MQLLFARYKFLLIFVLISFIFTNQLQAIAPEPLDLGEAVCLGVRDANGKCEENLFDSKVNSPARLISTLLPNIYIFSGVILFFLIIFGGFTIVTSGDNPEQTQKGTQAITWALIGFLIIVSSYWIIQIIEVITGIDILQSGIDIMGQ